MTSPLYVLRLSVFFLTFATDFIPGVVTYILAWILIPIAEGALPKRDKEGKKDL